MELSLPLGTSHHKPPTDIMIIFIALLSFMVSAVSGTQNWS
jgi:hypothetical protein